MKPTSIKLALLTFVTATSALHAETSFERELKQLQEQRDKAIASAAEPINRRYQTSLEQLLRHTTQANDLETAVKIKAELQNLQATVSASSTASPTASKAEYVDTEWTWGDPTKKDSQHTVKFLRSAKATGPYGETWTYKAITLNTIEISQNDKQTWKITFDFTNRRLDATDGTQHRTGEYKRKAR